MNKTLFNLEQIFQDFLEKERLTAANLIIMVSGGVDSMTLLEVATKVLPSNQIGVFHLNHNFREKSEADSDFVQKICSKKGVTTFIKSLEDRSEKNIEAHWRKHRKALSQEAAKEFKAERIITAHHASDLVETMIFRLTKGCGPSGLSPFETNTKPFWHVPKEGLLAYAQTHQIKWQEDSTNTDTYFQRNLIRRKVIPTLRSITPNLEKVFVKEATLFDQVDNFIQIEGDKQFGLALKKQEINYKDFLALHVLMQKELLRRISQSTVSQAEINDTLRWLLSEPSGRSQKQMGQSQIQLDYPILKWN